MALPGNYGLLLNQNSRQNSQIDFELRIGQNMLNFGWWSIIKPYDYFYELLLSKFPCLYYIIANILLMSICSGMVYNFYNFHLLINKSQDQSTIYFVYLNISHNVNCLFILFANLASTYTSFFKEILTSLSANYDETRLSKRFDNSISVQKSSINDQNIRIIALTKFKLCYKFLIEIFWKFFCFSWLFTLFVSLFFSYIIPAIHPDYIVYSTDWWFPLSYPAMLINFMFIMYYQILWVICYRLEEICNLNDRLFEQFEAQSDTKQRIGFSILEVMKLFCKQSLTITEKINDNIVCFMTILIILSFNLLIFPINQLKNLWKNSELTAKHFVALMLWTSISFFFVFYSLFRAIKIPFTYSETVKKFRIHIGSLSRLSHSLEFQKEVSSIL
jgi:hypothetical protein